MSADTDAVLDRSIGQNLDQLISVDMRGDEIARIVYRAARELTDEPLSLAAARALRRHLGPGSVAVILTGFRIPPTGAPETDGVIGGAVLAAALAVGLRATPVFVGEPEVREVLEPAVRAAGLHVAGAPDRARTLPASVGFLDVPADASDADAAGLADRLEAAMTIAIERPGANAQGYYHFAGGSRVEGVIAPLDALFAELSARGVPSLAIGDFGNELGMGAIAATVKAETPAGGDCGCGCGGGTANEVLADTTLAVTVSDWGAYAAAAALSHLVDTPQVLVDLERYRRIAAAATGAGAIDGTSRLAIPDIDGVPAAYHERLLEQLREVVALPRRPFLDNDNRRFRARRDAAEKG